MSDSGRQAGDCRHGRSPEWCAECLRAEVARLQGVIAQHDLCHDLHGRVGAEDFAAGCVAEQRRVYGRSPHADAVARLEAENTKLRSTLRYVFSAVEHARMVGRHHVQRHIREALGE